MYIFIYLYSIWWQSRVGIQCALNTRWRVVSRPFWVHLLYHFSKRAKPASPSEDWVFPFFFLLKTCLFSVLCSIIPGKSVPLRSKIVKHFSTWVRKVRQIVLYTNTNLWFKICSHWDQLLEESWINSTWRCVDDLEDILHLKYTILRRLLTVAPSNNSMTDDNLKRTVNLQT